MVRRILLSSCALFLAAGPALSDVSTKTLKSLSAPDAVETSAGKLEFRDGTPTEETAQKIRDTLDFTQALNVYNNSFRGASALALVKGFEEIGAKPGDVVIFPELMDSASLFLTANADTIYYMTGLDLTKGPVVAAVRRHRHDQRHVVFLGHRHRYAGAGSRARREVPDRRPWL